VLPGADEVKV